MKKAAAKLPFIRKVFLDTQVFKTANFNFNAKPLKLLKELSQNNRVEIYITDVVEREVRARMRREVEASRAWYNSMRKEAMILLSAKGTPFFSLPNSLDVEKAADSLNKGFDKYLQSADVEVIDSSEVKAGSILEAYFNLQAPFAEGEKRREFPDAISVEALAQAFTAKDPVFVISGDNGIKGACTGKPSLQHLSSIDEFLKLELADHEDVTWITDAASSHEEQIKEAISKAFSDGYFFLNDEDGEVEAVNVEQVTINEINLIKTSEEEAEFAVSCSVEFSADITYEDPNMTIYDEGEKFSFGTIEERVEREERDTFSVTAQLNRVEKTVDDFDCSDTKSRSFRAAEFEDFK